LWTRRVLTCRICLDGLEGIGNAAACSRERRTVLTELASLNRAPLNRAQPALRRWRESGWSFAIQTMAEEVRLVSMAEAGSVNQPPTVAIKASNAGKMRGIWGQINTGRAGGISPGWVRFKRRVVARFEVGITSFLFHYDFGNAGRHLSDEGKEIRRR
jgi:hypothetical protein